jgi:kynurenine formamidase
MITSDSSSQVSWNSGGPSSSQIFDLEQPRTTDMPVIDSHKPGYYYALHRRHADTYDPVNGGPRSSASGMIVCMEHAGTHIDALCHQADGLTLYGDIPVAEVERNGGFSKHGIEEVPPIVGPGVLLDVPASLGVETLDPGYLITTGDLRRCCTDQEVDIQAGDTVLVRTGNAQFWDDEARYLAGPGVAAAASVWLADLGVVAVGADNMAWDVIGRFDEEYGCMLPGHLILLAQRGIYIVENLQLEHLAAAKHYRCTFVCLPLKFVGATGSPVRPVAIVSS